MTKGIPRAKKVRERISATLKGVSKPPETRAAMAASKMFSRTNQPERWAEVYEQKLAAINAAERIKRIRESAAE